MTEHTTQCMICGEEAPEQYVEEIEVGFVEVPVCSPCRLIEQFERRDEDGVCMQCREPLTGSGWSIEIEHPSGVGDIPSRLTGTLCGECADWIAHRIKWRAVTNDPEADEELLDRIDEQTDAKLAQQDDREEQTTASP